MKSVDSMVVKGMPLNHGATRRIRPTNVVPERLNTGIEFAWHPFTLLATHLSFRQHAKARLDKRWCSCWGPAVYKWEGRLTSGPQSGKIGILIGETDDLRGRIKQYVTGTQEQGNI